MALRVGPHIADVTVDDLVINGAGVNLAARLGGPESGGQTILSVDAEQALIGRSDVETTDLGECHVIHLSQPIRAFFADRSQAHNTTGSPDGHAAASAST